MIWPAKFSSNTHPFNFPTRGTCKLESCHPPTKAKDFPITLANRDYNALFPLETPVSFLQILPHPSPYPQRSRKKIKTKNKRKQNNKNEKKKRQTNKQTKRSPQLRLLTVDLHMCYRHPTLSITTVDSWLSGVICEVAILKDPLQCFSWKLGSCRDKNSGSLSKQTQSRYLDWGNTQRQW